jgi:two-component system, OmpR family, sensor histidine kinase QseC
MTSVDPCGQRSLATMICLNLGRMALATVAIVSAAAFVLNTMDYDHLYLDHVDYETRALLHGVKRGPDGLSLALSPLMSRYDEEPRRAYGFRVLDATGRVIAARHSELVEKVSPWSPNSVIATDSWFVKLDGHKPFHFAGGKRLSADGADVLIEMMTLGDPAGVHWLVVMHETAEDVWLPMLPLVLLMPMVAVVSIRRALGPLAHAAQRAETINPADPTQRLELAGMPRETAAFASAINRLMERVGALVQSEKLFIASAAHELRTPLAVILLELEKIDHPRARRLEADVRGMAESVNRLVLLARLETVHTEPVDLDLATIAVETIDRMRAWAAAQEHRIDVRLRDPQNLRGDPVAVREALRNLVENAVRHTPAGTSIFVTVGPGSTMTVEDSGPGLTGEASDQLFQPFRKGNPSTEGAGLGLTIVRQAVELHRGSIQVGRSSLGGALFTLKFA